LRRRAQENEGFRNKLAVGLAVLAILFVFVMTARTGASVTIVFHNIIQGLGDESASGQLEPDDTLINELTLRYIVPPPMQDNCLTGSTTACATADELLVRDNRGWSNYLGQWIVAFIPGLVTGFLVRYITRDNRKQKMKA
jgi:hypothetical protein